MALCWSLDKVGPIARDVRDLALVFDVIHGRDPRDRSTVEAPFRFDVVRPLKDYRVAYVKGAFSGSRAAADAAALDVLRQLGANLEERALPDVPTRGLFSILNVEAAAAFDDPDVAARHVDIALGVVLDPVRGQLELARRLALEEVRAGFSRRDRGEQHTAERSHEGPERGRGGARRKSGRSLAWSQRARRR